MEHSREFSKAEIAKYRTMLEDKYRELTASLPCRENIAIDRRPDAMDEAIMSTDREIQARAFRAHSILVRDVLAALRRIQAGDYGTCDGCGQLVGRKRLDAIPWTPLCIRCQEEQEQQAADRQALPDTALQDAA